MARMFRSTSQPYYARKADVVGNLSSQTLDMLNNLVQPNYEDGDLSIRLTLDPSNTDQGYISYSRPSVPGEPDDYFSFDSLDFSVTLSVKNDGGILVNSTGKLYNNLIRAYSQFQDGDYDVMFTVTANTNIFDAPELSRYLTNKKYPCSGYVNTQDNTQKSVFYIVYEDDNFKLETYDGTVYTLGTTLPHLEIDAVPLTYE